MWRVRPAPGTELPVLHPAGVQTLVFRLAVIPLLALVASEDDLVPSHGRSLLDNFGDDACAHGATTLTDGEPKLRIHGDGADQLYFHLNVVPGHHHLYTLR